MARAAKAAASRPTMLEPEKVDAACAFIRDELQRASGSLERIGSHLIDALWGGDVATVPVHGPRKHPALRAIVGRADTVALPISKTALSNAIGLAVVARKLPPDSAFRRLSPSHQVELLPLRDVEVIERVARECAADPALTVRELRAAVRDMKPTGRGRSPTPPFLKVVADLGRVLGLGPACNVTVTPEEIAAVPYEVCREAERSLGMVGIHLDRLRRLVASVQLRRSDVGTRASTPPGSAPAEGTSTHDAHDGAAKRRTA